MHRTQFDRQLLFEGDAPLICRNHGRQIIAREDGSVVTALAWGGETPVLRLWRGHTQVAEHPLNGQPSAPCLLPDGRGEVTLWLSVNEKICSAAHLTEAPVPIAEGDGVMEDAASDAQGRTVLALRRGTTLCLGMPDGKSLRADLLAIDDNAGRASLEFDEAGTLHLAFEKLHAIEYRRLQPDGSKLRLVHSERPAEPFGHWPILLAHGGKIFLCYRGETCHPPDSDAAFWKDKPWSRRSGLGGSIAALVLDGGEWRRFALADSHQFVKPIWPKTKTFGYDYPNVDVRVRLDEFSPPGLTIGPDGVVQVIWANTARRWVFASRFLGESFSPAAEVRGPLEALTGPCLLPKCVPQNMSWDGLVIPTHPSPDLSPKGRGTESATEVKSSDSEHRAGSIASTAPIGEHPISSPLGGEDKGEGCRSKWSDVPLVMITRTRMYSDALRLPSRDVERGRRIDFLQPDELGECRGLELVVNAMRRFRGNPVMHSGGPGAHDEAGRVLMDLTLEGDLWKAQCVSKAVGRKWRRERPITSRDGIQWPQSPHIAESETYLLDGEPHPLVFRGLSYVEDPKETNPQHRFKGMLADGPPWGNNVPVTSSDAIRWSRVKDRITPIMSDGCYVWIDEDDVPERRFKAIGNARSFCGRVCAQWTSPDGMHWNEQRDSLDFNDPFGSEPYWSDNYPEGSTGRILVDPWAGPEDEDEIHGGVVFRDGDRWLLHYMKWTSDGHIIPALATSRDGIHFTRVGGGVATLPLGEPGTWDSGRIALSQSPFRLGRVWRQYYTGSGWKHGMYGEGKAPHRTSNNVGLYSPNQGGIAEIEVGHWANLRLSRDTNTGTLVTIPLHIARPHGLAIDVEGLDEPGSAVSCSVSGEADDTALPRFDFSLCDPILHTKQDVTWRGIGFQGIGSGTFRIAVRLTGHRTKLFGLDLRPMEAS